MSALALAILFWGLGSLASSIDALLGQVPRFTLVTQLCYSLFYPLLLIVIPRLSAPAAKLNPIELLDALIFGLGFTAVVTSLLITLVFPENSLLATNSFFTLFYPIGDLALLLVTATSLLTYGFNRQRSLLAVGILIFATTDIYYLWLAIADRYYFGSIADDGWLIAVALLAIALNLPTSHHGKVQPIPPALVAISIFISPILLAMSALRPELFPIYILAPLISILLLAFIRMTTALRQAEILGSEKVLARTDELTGLPNRRRMLAELEAFSAIEGALMLLDLNDFKPVNDQFGHDVGDEILREVAKRFHRVLPPDALLARLGGDEFGVLISGTMEETLEAAFALRACLTYPFNVDGRRIEVGVSVGLVHNDGKGQLLKRADEAMYRAKNSDTGVVRS
jgi:diguanylate cyclase (GGDEF)-like protein